MNREQRRLYNKKNHTNYSKKDFDMMIAVDRIKKGNMNLQDLDLDYDMVHFDNEELAPNGIKCKINFEGIKSRPQKDLTQKFINWVEKHKDVEFTLSREDTKNSLICFEEDVEEEPFFDEKGNKLPYTKWLFDLYADILLYDEDTDTYITPQEKEEKIKKNNEISSEEEFID